ncbi:putative F-box protein At4g09190 [Salvia hispanica]|uniref:putative F-box protein At4g09190 n=1 Tax=Salvia hispanica TaxID=49212 RepID=UPI00200975C9|nr:putative F-box protein At4g09190 [Salvia hispanica]
MKIKNRDRFNDLPREITVDILSRLPARSIVRSKCVCKAWRDLVQSPEFGPWHARRAALSSGRLPTVEDLTFSNPNLLFPEFGPWHARRAALSSGRLPTVEDLTLPNPNFLLLGFIDDNEVLQKLPNGFVLSHIPNSFTHSAVNGLLFMINLISAPELFICNPITREYVTFTLERDCWEYAFGFGVSKSGQHKLVMISQSQNTCQVYTLGTGQWRSIAIGSQFEYDVEYEVAFVNGNLHWLVLHDSREAMISCLDLETELFTSFSCPGQRGYYQLLNFQYFSLSDLGGLLCFSDDTYGDDPYEEGIKIWCMKEYGDDKSWTLDYVIKRHMGMLEIGQCVRHAFRYDQNMPVDRVHSVLVRFDAFKKGHHDFRDDYDILRHILKYNMSEHVNEDEIDDIIDEILLLGNAHDKLYPVKALQDGGILLSLDKSARIFYYPNVATKPIRQIANAQIYYDDSNLVIYSPSFVSLKSLVMDNMTVHSF